MLAASVLVVSCTQALEKPNAETMNKMMQEKVKNMKEEDPERFAEIQNMAE